MSKSTETKSIEVIIKGQQANASLKEMQSASRVLNAELRKLPVNSAEFVSKTKELQQVNSRLKSIQDDVKGVGGVFGKIGSEIKAFGIVAMGALGFQWLSGKISDLIGQNAKLSDSFAEIRRTTGMSEGEVKNLNKAFSQMNTRTATKDLREIAAAAGQLGISKKDILSFTAATDKLVVALGTEFTGGAEEVTKTMGTLRTVFSDIKTDNVSDDMLHIGNAINQLASAGLATGPVVADFANRIGGVGINLGLTSGQVLGLSATLQELNVSTERGGTAVSKILLKMTQHVDEFAKVAGVSTKDFTKLLNTDLYGAFIKVVEGSKKSGTSATEFSKILDNLGVDGAGASEVFSKLGSNTALLKEKVDLANVSLKNTDSIMSAFNLKNETFGAKIDKIGKLLTTAFVSGPIMKAMNALADGILSIVTPIDQATEAYNKQKQTVDNLVQNSQPLITRYDELKAKTTLTKDENTELNTIIQALSKSIPTAVTEWDKYGKALGINTAIAKDFIAEQKAILAVKNKDAIVEQRAAMFDLRKEIEQTMSAINKGYKTIEVSTSKFGASDATQLKDVKLTADEILAMSEKLATLQDQMKGRKGIVAELIGDKTDAQKAVDAAKKGAKEVQKVVIEIDEETKKKIIEAHKKLLERIAELEIEFYQKGLDVDTKEAAEVHQKYQKLLKEAAGFGEAEMRIKKLYVKEIDFVIQKQALEDQKRNAEKLKNVQKLQDEVYVATLSANDKELVAEMNKWDDLILKAETAGLDVTALRQAEADAINAIVVAQGKKETDATQKTEDEKEKIRYEKLALISKAYNEFERRVSRVMDAYLKAQHGRDESELKSNDTKLTSEQKKNDDALKGKLINQKQHDKKAIALQNEHDKKETDIKHKAAERDKQFAIAKAIIDGLGSVIKTMGAYPYPANLFMSALDAAIVGGEIAAIKSVDAYEDGGFNKSDNPQGYTTGPTLFTKSASGSPFIAGEKGTEWIATNWMTKDPETAPIIEHLETIRQSRSFAAGGNTQSATPKPVFSQPNNTAKNESADKLCSAIDRLNQNLEGGVVAYLDYDNYKRTLAKIDNAQKASRVG